MGRNPASWELRADQWGRAWSVWERGERVPEGPAEDGAAGKFTAVQLLLSRRATDSSSRLPTGHLFGRLPERLR